MKFNTIVASLMIVSSPQAYSATGSNPNALTVDNWNLCV